MSNNLPAKSEEEKELTFFEKDPEGATEWAKQSYLAGTSLDDIVQISGIPFWKLKRLVYGNYGSKSKLYKNGWKVLKEKAEEKARKDANKKLSERIYNTLEQGVEFFEQSMANFLASNPELSLAGLDKLATLLERTQRVLHVDIGKPTEIRGTERVSRQDIDEKLKQLNDFDGQSIEVDFTKVEEKEEVNE